jgi:transcriptional regulator with XRE-family HTH domain
MEHDIGCKIKAARIEKKLTQEQVAELLGVSRQTISNWENEKSYPDIISVIKMSECYDVSLDYLLKGEQKMKSYYDYLEESTNVVKSNANRNKIITILSYLLIWAFAMIVFWFFTSGSDAMGEQQYSKEQWDEKITDSINYFLILCAIVEEELNEEN